MELASQVTQPNDQISLVREGLVSVSTSGATHLVVNPGPDKDLPLGLLEVVTPTGRANPKSVITARCSSFTRIFAWKYSNFSFVEGLGGAGLQILGPHERLAGSGYGGTLFQKLSRKAIGYF